MTRKHFESCHSYPQENPMTSLAATISESGNVSLSLPQIANALGGEITGNNVRAPGPSHSPADRSLS